MTRLPFPDRAAAPLYVPFDPTNALLANSQAIYARVLYAAIIICMPPQDEPWYSAGLRFTCTRCGNCCNGEPGNVWVDDDEIDAIARFHDEPRDEFIARYTKKGHRGRTLREKANGDCVFFDRAAGCTIYAVRPQQCRTWPFWESNLRSPQTWERTGTHCPGAGRGELIAAEEITRRLKVIPL